MENEEERKYCSPFVLLLGFCIAYSPIVIISIDYIKDNLTWLPNDLILMAAWIPSLILVMISMKLFEAFNKYLDSEEDKNKRE